MNDVLLQMVDELREQRPAVYLADEYAAWEHAIGQTIAALPTREQRWAATVLVGNDLAKAMPGLPLSVAYGRILGVVLQQG